MSGMTKKDNLIIKKVKSLLIDKYNDLVVSVYCYGSRVTSGKQDADFDIMVITKEKLTWQQEYDMSSIIICYGIDNYIVFDPQFCFEKDFIALDYIPYIHQIHFTGIAI
ncbi:MAG: hypothetical protein WCJ01_02380 [Ignavibacteria bacterium]